MIRDGEKFASSMVLSTLAVGRPMKCQLIRSRSISSDRFAERPQVRSMALRRFSFRSRCRNSRRAFCFLFAKSLAARGAKMQNQS
jgi:hypothetical protein